VLLLMRIGRWWPWQGMLPGAEWSCYHTTAQWPLGLHLLLLLRKVAVMTARDCAIRTADLGWMGLMTGAST
jgi:hypothetical protein